MREAALLLIVFAPLACARGEHASRGSGYEGGTAGQGGEPSMEAGRGGGGTGGSPVPAALHCDRCGGAQEACLPSYDVCLEDDNCRALLACVSHDCALDVGGAACVKECLSEACVSPHAVALFLEADRCTYCTSACRDSCSTYCKAIEHDEFLCPEGVGGAGGTASAGGRGGGVSAGGAGGTASAGGRGGGVTIGGAGGSGTTGSAGTAGGGG